MIAYETLGDPVAAIVSLSSGTVLKLLALTLDKTTDWASALPV
jgi:hypothetical protein